MSAWPPDSPTVEALGWTLVHSLWQGALVAALLASVNAFFSRASAAARYVFASGALVLLLALPAVTLVGLLGPAPAAVGPGGGTVPSGFIVTTPVDSTAPVAPVVGAGLMPALADRLAPALPWLVAAWCAGVALLSIRALGGWALALRLRRSGRALPVDGLAATLDRLRRTLRVSRPVRLLESALVEVPTVVGWLRPVVLLPASMLLGLSPAQLEVILAHELAHVRRLDYLMNVLQTAAETLLFYHPAVWWISGRMRVEREHCCDDLAVAACGNPLSYARALADLEGLRVGPRLAMAAAGGSLLDRVTRLVAGPPARLSRSSRWLAGLAAVGSLAAAATAGAALRTAAWSALEDDADPQAEVAPAPQPSPSPRVTAAPRPRPAPKAAAAPAPAGTPATQRELTIDQIISLAGSGVTPEYLEAMDQLGFRRLSWEGVVELRSHGVTPEFVRAMAAVGHPDLSAEQLIGLRSQGVSPDYVRGLRATGLEGLSVSDLVGLRSQGVTPEFARGLQEAGIKGLSAAQLIALRSQGVTPEFVAALKGYGTEELSVMRLIALRSHGVNGDWLARIRALGYGGLSVPMLVGLRSHGINPEYIQGLQEHGYRGLSAPELVELRSHGVTPEYVGELKEAGFSGLTAEELIKLRSQGIRAEQLRRLRRQQ